VYAPGELKAVAYRNGRKWAEATMQTTDSPAKVELSADRPVIAADGSDLSFVTVQISDKKGRLVPRSNNQVGFSISGPGEIIAVDNGDPTSHESFQASQRKAFNGLCLVVVRSKRGESGTIRLSANSEGLEGASVRIKAQ